MPATLIHSVPLTITFISEAKKFGFAARQDTGESVYISPMLAEQRRLDRASGGRVLCATLAPNTDDHGGQATTNTPWRVMSWSEHQIEPGTDYDPTDRSALRADLTDLLRHVDQLQANVDQMRARVRATLNHLP